MGRAFMSQLSVLMGARASGTAIVKAKQGAGPQQLLPNTYCYAIVKGTAQLAAPYKVAFNPATLEAHQQGGAWLVPESGAEVSFTCALGGAQYNFPAPAELVFAPGPAEIEERCEVTAPGFSGGDAGPVKQIVVYDDFTSADQAKGVFEARLGAFPAIMLAWMNSTPIEGRTAGISQGATRKARGVRAYFENWTMYVIASTSKSGEHRRAEGLAIMEAARAVLGDHHRNVDGEMLSNMGTGVEIMTSTRLPKTESSRVFSTTMRAVSVRKRLELRGPWTPWDWTRIRSFFRQGLNDSELDLHDFVFAMDGSSEPSAD